MNIVKILEMAFMITGGFFCLAISVALLAYAYNVISEWREHWEQKRFYRAKERAVREIGHSLSADSYWFEESKETYTALNMIGIEMTHTGCTINVSNIREAWRKSVADEKTISAK